MQSIWVIILRVVLGWQWVKNGKSPLRGYICFVRGVLCFGCIGLWDRSKRADRANMGFAFVTDLGNNVA